MAGLKSILDRFYRQYDFRARLCHDPIEIPRRFKEIRDREIAGFITASFAYGKVGLFKPVIEKILTPMGRSPYDFILHFKRSRHAHLFRGIRYRFNKTEDILCFLFLLHQVVYRHRSLENLFMQHYRNTDPHIGNALTGMVGELLNADSSEIYGHNEKPSGLTQLIPSPAKGSACKRQNLFLRWMVRDRDIDFGMWKSIPKDRLVIPLDTHIMKISQCLGLTKRKAADWKTAVEITAALRKFDPGDPLKYDFALCHQGISGHCTGQGKTMICRNCVFKKGQVPWV